MTKRFLILFFTSVLFPIWCYPQNISDDDRIRYLVRQYGQAEVSVHFTNYKSIDNLTRNVSILSVKDKVVYVSLSLLTVEWFIQQVFDYQIIKKTDIKGIISAASVSQALEWDSYPTYSQYDSIMQNFRALYPELCHLDTIGTSVNGKLVLALKISDDPENNEDEPEVFYSSTIHGDETGGFILMLRLADYLLKNHDLDLRVKNLVDNLEIWINPLANPDGTYYYGNSITSPVRFNAEGYDLNRNFPDPDYPSIVQRKETLDMIEFLRHHRFVLSANFHAGVEVVNYPWDRWSRLHPDDEWFFNISRKYADTVHLNSLPGYMTYLDDGITNGYAWYSINGGRQDFVTYALQGREVTIELDNNYITPIENLNSLWDSNRRSLLGYLENALYGIHGHVRDVSNHVPVPARIFISGHDKDNSHVYADSLTGSFVRLLNPGTWDLLFSANHYKDTLITNVVVTESQKTEILVEMKSDINPVDTSDTYVPILYPNPGKTFIKAVLPESMFGTVSVRIFNQSGTLMSDHNAEAMKGVPLLISVERLSGGIYSVVFKNTETKISCRARLVVIN